MYKSKLQELCQQRAWELPNYEAKKQGQDHNPLFFATVTVNSIPFSSSSPSTSSKKAQNDAAKLAYEHFSSSSSSASSSGSTGVNTPSSPGGTLQSNLKDANQIPQSNGAVAFAKNDATFGGVNETQTHTYIAEHHHAEANAIETKRERGRESQSPHYKLKGKKKQKMDKSKLQELCQQRAWELPNYEATKHGQDHDPLFFATVNVNSISFPSPSTSSKKAQNDAAKLAYEHFSSSASLSGSTGVNTPSSLGGTLQLNLQDANPTPQPNEAVAVANNDVTFGRDMPHLFKNQLQTYAQKRNFTLPVYSCERVGPPHASRFKCKVTVNGQTYETEEYFPTLNKAELAAAKAALMSLLPNGVEEDEYAYKNLLQELAQREGSGLAIYSTEKSGEAHAPTFVSTVKIGGEIFTGQGAKTKKQAEMSAAKIAYTALKQRYSSHSPAFLSTSCQFQEARSSTPLSPAGQSQEAAHSTTCLSPAGQAQEAVQSTRCLSPARQEHQIPQLSASSLRAGLAAYLQQNIQPKLPVRNEKAEEYRADSEVSSQNPSIASPGLHRCSASTSITPSPGAAISSSPKNDLTSSSLPSDSSTSLAKGPSIEFLVERNTPCQSRVIVHPRGTTLTYPAGSIVLPISDNKWVAVKVPPQPSQ